MEALRVKNLRCLGDTKSVPIKPITLLVGRNSSGKSTFLRIFPLLRQSVETATESPLLWYGRYVDLGSIQTAVGTQSATNSVTFEFSLKLKGAGVTATEQRLTVAMELAEDATTHGAYVSSYEIRVAEHVARLRFTPNGRAEKFTVNKLNVLEHCPSLYLRSPAFIIPSTQAQASTNIEYLPVTLPLRFHARWPRQSPEYSALVKQLYSLFHGNTSPSTVELLAEELRVGSREAMFAQLKGHNAGPSYKQRAAQLSLDSYEFRRIVDWTIAAMVPEILGAFDQRIADFMARVAYLGPQRTLTERSYRIQDLSVSEVAPHGENLAMFLRSLSKTDINSFSAFTREYLGFESSTQGDGLHAEIRIKESGSATDANLVDVGFGYSQVLPLAAILWSTCCRDNKPGRYATSLLAIEQPELHLHPAHQAKLARMLVGALHESRKAGREIRLMVETHSEAIVNGTGELVHNQILAPDDVQIVLFEHSEETRQTSVRLAGYDEDGALRNWPFGFFAPVADD
ncbi:AAA family ATPase [Sorangium sp. So ce363]|uniref:AAA family ATPase n=1 Tax=Sorangium sp. So ce363 TaxID=3133304 RepID=UPI003F5D8E0E